MVPENKQNRIYKQINLIGLQNNRHPSQHTVGNFHKASENCQQRHLQESIAEPLSHVLDCRHVCKTCAFHDALQTGKQKKVHRTPLIWRPQAPD
jgi:hypothetical protein